MIYIHSMKYKLPWEHLQDTTTTRTLHSSAIMIDGVLLIGGYHSKSTEWIPIDGSAAQQGLFTVRHGHQHSTIQISADIIVVTGGFNTEDFVTEDKLTGNKTPLR